MRRAALLLWVLTGLLVGGCGGASPAAVRVALDFTPNPAHAPLYLARGATRLRIVQPGSGPDSLKLLLSGRVDIAVLDIDDLGLAVERGAPIVGVAALVQQPLGALIAQPGIHTPRQLAGRRVGVSGLPSDPAFLRAILGRVGLPLASVHQVTIGFNAVADLVAGTISAVPAFWSDEAVALRRRGVAVNVFRIDRYGAPEYPEVVLAVRRDWLAGHRARVLGALAAIARGQGRVLADPAAAVRAIVRALGGGDAALVAAQTRAIRPALSPALVLSASALRRWAAFTARTGLLPRRLDPARAFDLSVAPAALRLSGS